MQEYAIKGTSITKVVIAQLVRKKTNLNMDFFPYYQHQQDER
ncbi:hypothetical protein bcere0022_8870 [Bacillus cereus Rock3-44]|nr:hypothetical protein bcere0022_8870 [Bacillus cereus Rock3-44]